MRPFPLPVPMPMLFALSRNQWFPLMFVVVQMSLQDRVVEFSFDKLSRPVPEKDF